MSIDSNIGDRTVIERRYDTEMSFDSQPEIPTRQIPLPSNEV